MPEINDLRSKLREKRGSGALTPPPPAPRRKKKAKSRKPEPGLAGLDVNRKMLFVALGIAGTAALLAITYLSSAGDQIMAGATKVEVIVPARDIPTRTAITEDMIELKAMPKGLLPKGHLLKKEEVVGKVSLTSLVQGEVLLDVRVSPPNELTGLAPKLNPDERGFILALGEANEIALIKPDDHVDLIANISDPNEKLISTPILQMVRVIGIGNRFNPNASPDPNENGYTSGTLTLAIPAAKFPLMTVLKQQGKLNLALRAPGDTTVRPPEIPEAEIARLVMGKVPPAHAPQAPKPETTVIYRPQAAPQRVIRVVRPAAPRPRPVAPKPHVGIEIIKGGSN